MSSPSASLRPTKKRRAPSITAKLRRDAERRVGKQPVRIEPPTSEVDAQRPVHDMGIYHGELELRNAQLRQSRAQVDAAHKEFEDLYQNAPCGYHTLDENGVFVLINDTELRWLGYSRDEVVGKLKLIDLLPAAGRPKFRNIFRTTVESGDVRDVYMELIRKDGSRLPVLANAIVIRDSQGRFVCTRSTLTDMTVAKRLERKLAAHARRLWELSHRLVARQEDERRRLAEELHTRTSSSFAAIKINLKMIVADLPKTLSPDFRSRIEESMALLEEAVASIRETCANLRPPLLDYAGLVPALEEFARSFTRRTGIAVQFAASQTKLRLAPDVESKLFRIAQEALTNCAKHARAKAVNIELTQDANHCALIIADDGIGFDPTRLGESGRVPGLGLLNMRERAEFIGGAFSIESKLGHGTRIKVIVKSAAQ